MPDTALIARMNDLAEQAVKKGLAHSKFLTSAEAEEVRRAFQNRKDVPLIFDGGFDDAERKVAVFKNPDWGEYRREEVIAALSVKHRKQDVIGHRDVLGAALGLGIKREVLGDIFIGEPTVLICLADMADFICDELKQAGRMSLTVGRNSLSGLPEIPQKLDERTDTVASLRLDAVIAAIFNCSRNVAAETIVQGRVRLANRICEDISKNVGIGDIISVRGLGRAKLLELGGQSKKGRTWIKFGMYI